ncbi:MAG: hypothetical protein J4F41_05360 [Alphaproteobacteria bacterium]|nr:hypothetical protein [Alphaproteobacteria bacterium]
MAPEEFFEEVPPPLALLPLHFDVEEHLLASNVFVKAIETTELMTKAINEIYFDGKAQVHFYISPPRRGGFIEVIAIAASLTAILVFHQSDTFKGFYKGLTGKDYDAYQASKKFGEVIRDLIAGFFTSNTKQIRDLTKDDERFDRPLKSKSDFIESCQSNEKINGFGIGFDYDFQVERKDFKNHKSDGRLRRKPDKVLHLYGSVLKPVMLANQKATWEILYTTVDGQLLKTPKVFNGFMEDTDFSSNFYYGDTSRKWPPEGVKIEVEVLITQLTEAGEIKSKPVHEITKVISFDGERLVPSSYIIGSASEKYLEKCLSQKTVLEVYKTNDQPTLFDDY